jgi:hypothetical protein
VCYSGHRLLQHVTAGVSCVVSIADCLSCCWWLQRSFAIADETVLQGLVLACVWVLALLPLVGMQAYAMHCMVCILWMKIWPGVLHVCVPQRIKQG